MASLNLPQARDVAVQRFFDNWTGTPLSLVIVQNQDNSTVDNQEEPWVRISVNEIGGGQQTLSPLGSRKYRREAAVIAQIYTPKNEGVNRAGLLSEEARTIYEGRSFGGLDFNDAQVLPTLPEEKWQQTSMVAEFKFDEIK